MFAGKAHIRRTFRGTPGLVSYRQKSDLRGSFPALALYWFRDTLSTPQTYFFQGPLPVVLPSVILGRDGLPSPASETASYASTLSKRE